MADDLRTGNEMGYALKVDEGDFHGDRAYFSNRRASNRWQVAELCQWKTLLRRGQGLQKHASRPITVRRRHDHYH